MAATSSWYGKLLCFLKAGALARLLFVDTFLLSPDIPLPWSLPEVLECHQVGEMGCALSGQRHRQHITAEGITWTLATAQEEDGKGLPQAFWLSCSGSGLASQEDGSSSATVAAAAAEQQNELQEKPRPTGQGSASSTWSVLPGSHMCACLSPVFL